MKGLKGVLFLCAAVIFLLALHGLAHGSPSDCEFIKDPDDRNYCRAVAKHERSWCEFIKNNDLRHKCRALADAK